MLKPKTISSLTVARGDKITNLPNPCFRVKKKNNNLKRIYVTKIAGGILRF